MVAIVNSLQLKWNKILNNPSVNHKYFTSSCILIFFNFKSPIFRCTFSHNLCTCKSENERKKKGLRRNHPNISVLKIMELRVTGSYYACIQTWLYIYNFWQGISRLFSTSNIPRHHPLLPLSSSRERTFQCAHLDFPEYFHLGSLPSFQAPPQSKQYFNVKKIISPEEK